MTRLAAIVLSVLLACPLFVSSVSAAQPSAGSAGQVDLASCVRSRHSLALLLLMDTSASLGDTDPEFRRVTSAQLAVDGLANQLKSGGLGPDAKVEVAVTGFAGDVDESRWLNLRDSPDELATAIKDVGGRHDGTATDYVAALQGAQVRLAEQAATATAAGGGRPCQALIWFTDGKNQPEGTGTTEADTKAAEGDLCRPDGVVDRLRATGASLLTVALTGEILPAELTFLRKIAGEVPGCGTRAADGGSRYLSADEKDLIYKLFQIIEDKAPDVFCDGAGRPCTFTLDPAMSRFYVVIQTIGDVGDVSLVAPDGSTTALSRPGAAAPASGASLSWQWFDKRTVRVNGELPGAAAGRWAGAWKVVAPGGTSGGRLYLYGNLELRLTGTPRFVRGEPWRFGAAIAALSNSAVPGDLARLDPVFTAKVIDGTDERQATVSVPPGRVDTAEFDLTAPDSWHSAEVTLEIRVGLRTSTGVDLSPPMLIQRVAVVAPLLVRPTSLTELPSVNGHASTGKTITVEATEGGGCFWLAGDVVLASDDATVVTTTSHPEAHDRSSCVPVRPGSPGNLDVRFTVEHSSTGTAIGAVPLMLMKDGQAAVPYTIPVSFSMVAVPDRQKALRATAGIGVATLTPLLLFLLVNWLWLAKFEQHRDIRVRVTRIEVTPRGQDVVIGSSRPGVDWTTDELARPPDRQPRTKLVVGPVTFRTRFSLRRPFASPWTRVSGSGGYVLATPDDGPARALDHLPTCLPGTVVLAARDLHESGFTATVVHIQNLEPFAGDAVERFRQAVHEAALRLTADLPETAESTQI
jgi:hypothetical protein